jgi:hypothetical protein
MGLDLGERATKPRSNCRQRGSSVFNRETTSMTGTYYAETGVPTSTGVERRCARALYLRFLVGVVSMK